MSETETFLHSAGKTLRQARIKAGLSQEEVAARLGTKQAAISRLENDTEGAMSLHTFIDYVLVCGMVPLNITHTYVAWARIFIKENPGRPLTRNNLLTWNAARIARGTNVILDPKEWQVDY